MQEQHVAPANFVHLHVHTQYSLLDGAIRLPDLFDKCKAYGMEAVTITDHGAMYGALEFYVQAKAKGLKPIVGCEFYIAPDSRFEKKAKSAGRAAFHIVLLAMNHAGYKNLLKLASLAQLEGFHYKPRIDKEILALHSEGLIALTACLHGEIPHCIAKEKNMAMARQKALELKDIFGDRLYFEMQENNIPEQTVVNQGLMQLARELDIPLVATNDCHYLRQEDAPIHDVLLCIQTGKTLQDANRFRFSTDELYFKTPEEMRHAFAYCPEALENTVKIAERCNLEIEFGNNYFPNFTVPEGESLDSLFEDLSRQGFKKRFAAIQAREEISPELEETYRSRLDMELGIIKTMGFPGYFLIVADFINWAKDQDIPVGPGRGSGAGSLVAFAMGITDIDPIKYGLIFERFLNVERQSMPDFDVDFCQERRGEVIRYVHDKYGGDAHVCQIITYGSMKAKGVIRDVGRALGMTFSDVDRVAKLIPDELKMTLKKALLDEPRLKDLFTHDNQVKQLLEVGMTLEGLQRHTSIHAAGVVISPEPMVEYLPVCKGPKGEVLTQYDMKYTEKTGLIKFDFLGLKTLTVIDRALKIIKKGRDIDLDISQIPMDDQKTYDLLVRGDALGVFQLESSGMRQLLMKMKPEQFSDLIALVALYRPGPLESGMVDDFVNTKHGRMVASYPLPQLEPILKETYGVIVYQEQVMKIANVLADYSLGDADNLRRAMGKKIADVMEAERVKFMAGAKKLEVDLKKAEYVFDLMAKFAGYGFNKSHSAAYAYISYQTAYLKAHFPAEFMAALLSCDVNNTDKVVRYIQESQDHGIAVLPSDINESDHDFTVIKGDIRFGLAAVKNVGGAALDSIIEVRKSGGFYKSLGDFCTRVDSRKVNKRVIESLVKAGAFDTLGGRRAQIYAILDQAMEQAQAAQRDRESGQISLFSAMAGGTTQQATDIPLPDIPEWDDRQRLAFEKETVGFYITGHPLDNVKEEMANATECAIIDLAAKSDGSAARVGGLIKTLKNHKSKKGDAMAFLTLEDVTGEVEVVVFPSAYGHCSHLLSSDEPLVIQGQVQKEEEGGAKILADEVFSLADALERYTTGARIFLHAEKISRQKIEELKTVIHKHHGPCPVSLTLHFPDRGEADIEIQKDLTIMPSAGFSRGVAAILGPVGLTYQKKQAELVPRKNNKSWQKKAS
ncbi:MAG: DNA polymerase III subunit alpha [Desulfurivibrionaceae bacterium]|nr:DNA polymerase III subunit alpha [Desulfurivibrionaceae bacterium]